MSRIRERSPGVYEVTVSTGRRSPKTGRYVQMSRTVRARPMRPEDWEKQGDRRWPKPVLLEEAKMIADAASSRRDPGRYTLAELLDDYLEHQQARGRAPSTLLHDRLRAAKIKADPIGSKDIQKLTGWDIDGYLFRLGSSGGRSGAGLHQTTRHHYFSLIRAALNQAIRWHRRDPPNPAGEAEAPKLRADRRPLVEPDQVRQFALRLVADDYDLASLIFADATTGMRRGEICGLRFRDVDVARAQATVWWRCCDLPIAEAAKIRVGGQVLAVFPELGVVMLDASKNGEYRRFALDSLTLEVVAEQRRRAEELAAAVGRTVTDDCFVWSQDPDHSRPWRPGRVTSTFRIRRDKWAPGLNVNDLRHFSATQLLAAGFDPKTVSERHGHDVALMMRIYAAVVPARDQEAAGHMGGVLGPILGLAGDRAERAS